MSNADSEEVSVVVERGGIRVEKSFEPDDFPVPAIAFVIHSDREETTDVRIVDDVPSDIPAQDIGFHPKYGADFWRVEDGQIVFEREFEPGEEYTTVYGLRAKDTDDIERFLTEPSIEGVEGEETVSDIIGDDEAEADGESEADSESEADADEADDEEPVMSLELDDPLAPDEDEDQDEEETEAETEDDADVPSPVDASANDLESAIASIDQAVEDGDGEEDQSDGDIDTSVEGPVDEYEAEAEYGNGTAEAVAVDDIAATLAAEIRAGEVSDDDLETLSEALTTEAEVPGHVEAKLDKLQADVDEVMAYAGALEEFLDDAGTADELLAMRERFDDIEEDLDLLEGTVSSVESRVDGRMTTIEDDLEALRNDLEALEDDLGEDLSNRVADIEAELDEMEDDIQTLDNIRQALAGE